MANVKHKMYVIVRLSCDVINMVIKPIEIVTEYYWKIYACAGNRLSQRIYASWNACDINFDKSKSNN